MRVLKHYRFSKFFAAINRTVRSRRKPIKYIRSLYGKLGLIEDGCSFCGQREFTLLSEGDRYGFDLKKQICNHCGLVQTYPKLSPEFHEKFYSNLYRPLYLKSQEVDYNSVIEEQSDKAAYYLNYFNQNGLQDKLKDLSVIEIGCSSGGTINGLKPFVKSVQGCDLDINAIAFAKEKFGLSVEAGMCPTQTPKGAKLFIMSHVLEHVFNPFETLKKVRSLMTDNDYLFIAVPGINMVAEGDYKHDLRRYFHLTHVD